MSNEVIKCLLIDEPEKTGLHHKFVLEYLDGTPVPEEEIDIGQNKWPYKYPANKRKFTWKFLNHTNDIPKELDQIRACQLSMNSIQLITGLDIDYETDPDAQTDITKEFFMDLDVFGGRTNVLAQAYLYSTNSRFNGVQQYNDKSHIFTPYGWPIRTPDGRLLNTQPLVEIDMHESMHTFGYRHDLVDPNSLLYPYVKPGYILEGTQYVLNRSSFVWHERDVHRWHDGYGASNLSNWLLNRWQNYRINKLTPDTVPELRFIAR